MIELEETASIRDVQRWFEENYMAVLVGQSERQHFGHELADLLGREVDDSDHLFPDEIFLAIMMGDLRGIALFSKTSKIDF